MAPHGGPPRHHSPADCDLLQVVERHVVATLLQHLLLGDLLHAAVLVHYPGTHLVGDSQSPRGLLTVYPSIFHGTQALRLVVVDRCVESTGESLYRDVSGQCLTAHRILHFTPYPITTSPVTASLPLPHQFSLQLFESSFPPSLPINSPFTPSLHPPPPNTPSLPPQVTPSLPPQVTPNHPNNSFPIPIIFCHFIPQSPPVTLSLHFKYTSIPLHLLEQFYLTINHYFLNYKNELPIITVHDIVIEQYFF